MKTLTNARNLRDFGIEHLTGEACAYSMRVLCDLSEKGAVLVSDFFGLTYDSSRPAWGVFNANWNSMVGDDPAVASVMLPPSVLPALARFAMFHVEKADFVIEMPGGGMVGLRREDEYAEKYLKLARANPEYCVCQNFSKASSPGPAIDGRNIHAFTGRAV